MNPWRQFPLLRLIIPFIGGLILAIKFPVVPGFLVLIVIFFLYLLFLFLVLFHDRFIDYSTRWITGFVIMLLTVSIAYDNALHREERPQPGSEGTGSPGNSMVVADIIEPVIQKSKTTKVFLRIRFLNAGGKWIRADGKILVYFQKETASPDLNYGDRVILYAELREPPGPMNPYSFNYKRFLEIRGIYFQGYCRQGTWRLISRDGSNPFIRFALELRKKLLIIFRENQIEGREFAVGAALLLGYTDEIDPGLMKDYAATGAMHILSVSGMHVGIIFLVLEKLLLFLKRYRHGILLKTLLVIILVWFYALLTGLSPSVLRSAAMLSLVATGNYLKRNHDLVNTLGVSMLLLLMWDPMLLMDVGFQLSYLAVGGIVLIYQPLYKLFVIGKWLPDQVWGIIAVSLAAQVATFPLGLFYFHQFPNYFMITNIVVVPLSSLIIYTGIILLFMGGVPLLPLFLAKVFAWMIWLLNSSIHFIEQLPYSTFKGIYISPVCLVLIYILITCSFLFIKTKSGLYILSVAGILIVISSFSLCSKVKIIERKKIIVYHNRQGLLLELIGQGSSILAGTRIFTLDEQIQGNLQNSRWALKYSERFRLAIFPSKTFDSPLIIKNGFFRQGRFIQFEDKRIAIINREIPMVPREKLKINILILTGNPAVKLDDITKAFIFDQIVIDVTNQNWKVREWMNEAAKLKIRIYSMFSSGAFEMDF
jgi:competence protein ComEC